jgi:ketosteroid isomerase-like protein
VAFTPLSASGFVLWRSSAVGGCPLHALPSDPERRLSGTGDANGRLTVPPVNPPGEEAMTNEERNMQLMQTLDDAWNAQDLATFGKRHRKEVVVHWPGKPPTNGIEAHEQEAIDFFKTFPDQHLVNRPYRVFFASADWTCSVARFTGTMTGPMQGADGKMIQPTGKAFDVEFCTVAHWDKDGQIIEENLFYDLVTFMKQIGLG